MVELPEESVIRPLSEDTFRIYTEIDETEGRVLDYSIKNGSGQLNEKKSQRIEQLKFK
jgi:hypothetical protein